MARPERFELPAFWFVAQFLQLHPTTPTNYNQQNNRKGRRRFGSFGLLSAAVHGHSTDNREPEDVSAGDRE